MLYVMSVYIARSIKNFKNYEKNHSEWNANASAKMYTDFGTKFKIV